MDYEGFFLYGEEGDLCCRAQNANYKIMYNPNSKVKHLKSGTSKKDSILSYFNRVKSDQRYALLNYSIFGVYKHFFIGIPIAFIKAIIIKKLSLLYKAYLENFQN